MFFLDYIKVLKILAKYFEIASKSFEIAFITYKGFMGIYDKS